MRDPRRGVGWSRQRIVRRVAYGCWMASPAWFDVRRAWHQESTARHAHPPTCAICDTPWTLEGGDLHHRTYRRLGHERFEDLTPCCRDCHDHIHATLDTSPAWRRMDRAQATDLIVRLLRNTQLVPTTRTP